jgi:2-polyprenyl-6-methoxyphenol hydroxylase-like FAD-dependent oxidoreductase
MRYAEWRGLLGKLIRRARPQSTAADRRSAVLLDQPDKGTAGRPEVLRGDLRRILLGSLPDGAVQWGRKATGVRPLGDGRPELTSADGSSVTSGLLVGADGAWSKIRPLLSDATPEYVGAPRSSRPTCTTPASGTRRPLRRLTAPPNGSRTSISTTPPPRPPPSRPSSTDGRRRSPR